MDEGFDYAKASESLPYEQVKQDIFDLMKDSTLIHPGRKKDGMFGRYRLIV